IASHILTANVAISHADVTPTTSASPVVSASPTPTATPISSASPVVSASPTPTATPTNSISPNQPRKILTGWIPYYSMKTALPSAILNADLIQQVSPFWFTLKNQNTITDLYTPANPSVPMTIP